MNDGREAQFTPNGRQEVAKSDVRPGQHIPTLPNGSQKNDARPQPNKTVYDNFMKTILDYNRRNNTPISEPPQIGGKAVNLYILYGYVLKAGGSILVDEKNHWDKISLSLGFPEHGEAISEIHKRCLRGYEKEWLAKRKLQARLQRESNENATSQQTTTEPGAATPQQVTIENVKVTPDVKNHTPLRGTNGLAKSDDSAKPVSLYRPMKRDFDTYAGIEVDSAVAMTKDLARLRPFPAFQELGKLDIQGVTRSIESELPAEVANALDIMVVIAGDRRWGLPLVHCADLLEVLVECLLKNITFLARQGEESDSEFSGYLELIEAATYASNHLAPLKRSICPTTEEDAALQRVMSIMTILRNLAFTEINQEAIAKAPDLARAISQGILAFCPESRHSAISIVTALDFAKDAITLLSLIGAHLLIEDVNSLEPIFQLFLSFVSDSSSSLVESGDKQQPYMFAAVDAASKILARDVPNRQLCESLLSQKGSLYTTTALSKLMALSLLILPRGISERSTHQLAQRFPLLQHSLILAELAAEMCPRTNALPTKWLESTSDVPLRLSVLIYTLSSHSFPRGMVAVSELAIVKRRSISVLRTLLDKSGNLTNRHAISMNSASRIERLVHSYEADIQL